MKKAPKTATALKLMQGSPPKNRVTMENWYMGDPVRWSFKNIPQLIPCAEAHRGSGPTTQLPKADQSYDIPGILYKDHTGQTVSVGEMLNLSYTDAFLVLHRGAILHEAYRDMADYQRHLLQSVSKSLTACLLAVMVEKGAIDVTQSVAFYLPEFADSAYGDTTLQQVLDMTASVNYDETYENMLADVNLHTIAGGWYGHVERSGAYKDVPLSLYDYLPTLREKADYAHGEVFRYISANTDVLGLIIERVGQRPFMQLFQEHIWQHLGAEENAAMTVDPWGCAFPCGGFNLTLRDLARVGLMILGDGWFNDRQIVPTTFFTDTRQNGSNRAWQNGDGLIGVMPHGAYRNQFWVTGNEHGAFFGWGIHGQYLYVDPTAEMVIAKFSSHPAADNMDVALTTLTGFHAIAQTLIRDLF
ncbi:MAG: serine hydrolase [Chloroflexota bacterium]